MERKTKIGEGTYGVVYSGSLDDTEYAVKRNIIEKTTNFMGSLKELHILSKVRNYPFFVNLTYVNFESPFSKGILSPIRKPEFREDSLYFIFEKATYDGNSFMEKAAFQYIHVKLAMMQCLLGLEFFHAKGYIHRDLKPANLLFFVNEEGNLTVKICDFGLSKSYTSQGNQTPRVVTAWYRAPEIALSNPQYGYNIDIWSLGCIFFEMLARKPLYGGISDSNRMIVESIIRKHPFSISKSALKKLSYCYPYRMKNVSVKRPYTMDYLLNFNDANKKEFNQGTESGGCNTGNYNQLQDLLSHMLEFNPDERYGATDALNHQFFDNWRYYINYFRQQYPPVPDPLPKVIVHNIPERQWAAEIIYSIYRSRNEHEWYSHRIIFQSLSIFDRYLNYLAITEQTYEGGVINTSDVGSIITGDDGDSNHRVGKYLTPYLAKLHFTVCLYVAIKYFSTLKFILSFQNLVSKTYCTTEALLAAEEFEIQLIRDILNFEIYNSTMYEAADVYHRRINDDEVWRLLSIYCRLSDSAEYTSLDLYRFFSESQ